MILIIIYYHRYKENNNKIKKKIIYNYLILITKNHFNIINILCKILYKIVYFSTIYRYYFNDEKLYEGM